jgi:pyrroloquinoline quinone biosynthesis protein D
MNTLADAAKPRIAPKARLKWDAAREKNLLLYPEGVLVLNGTAHEILALCDGQRSIAQITETLSQRFNNQNIGGDVKELLSRLMDKGLVVAE